MNKKVLVVDPLHQSALDQLADCYDVEYILQPAHCDFIQLCRPADALVLRSGVTLNKEVLNQAHNLKVIVRAGNGMDNIDLDFTNSAGIPVFNIPGASTISVAEHTFALMLALTRNVAKANQQLKEGVWDKPQLSGIELFGKTIGIVGLGQIGMEVARIAKGFEMKVLATVKFETLARKQDCLDKGIELIDMQRLLKQSDVVCLHTPLTTDTKALIGQSELALMKNSSILINMARGGVCDEQALYEAIKERRIAGAASDVFSQEREHNELFELDNFVATPHIGAMTDEAQIRVGAKVVEYIKNILG
jgi:D-3-phosphoglycerate dehydrogenase